MDGARESRGEIGSMLFDNLKNQPADPLLSLIRLANADERLGRIDLGVGVYRDAEGRTPILRAVKAAERLLLETQVTKAYLGPEGDLAFVELIRPLLLGDALAGDSRIVGVQTPGGCGALRLGAELLQSAGGRRMLVGRPTWPNHEPIFGAAGLEIVEHGYYDRDTATLLWNEMREALLAASAGDIVLLHGSCHNPAGADLLPDMWREVADIVAARGLIPFIDMAYQGLGNGLEPDAAGMRLVVEAAEQALVAQSCDKNFGLYRERTGALFVKSARAETVFGNLLQLARAMWSMPPDHGAAIVRVILEDAALRSDWRAELDTMHRRIRSLRVELAEADPRLAYIADQNGMFSLLPISKQVIDRIRADHGVYMAASGRINVAGFAEGDAVRFAAMIADDLPPLHG
ncbi:MAG: Aspartate aminotransferase [uncultured Sphingomonadaceae bacterium]|uniref:Aspartate aminotransferase n=1 Tax=uncultured Sphingomonadaceae bacterium TaxID=169976 RepID=A0A6J4RVN3_9SPHN|nr:MAG: Aspartate aminotransferase [uncultured Sphingomonadaceae bacterium]